MLVRGATVSRTTSLGLLSNLLSLRHEQWIDGARIDRDIPLHAPADGACEFCPLNGLAGHRRNAKQRTARLAEQIGEADGIVDIRADVRIEEHLDWLSILHRHFLSGTEAGALPSWPTARCRVSSPP
jgi:hypothetical protein